MRQSDEYLSEKWTPAVEKLALEDLLEEFFFFLLGEFASGTLTQTIK